MPKKAGPWFRASDGWWYHTVRDDPSGSRKRRHVRLSQDKDEAFDLWHEASRLKLPSGPQPQVFAVLDEFLDWTSKNRSASTFEWYEGYLQTFADLYDETLVASLKPHHVTKWIDFEGYKEGAKRAAITSIKRALNWAAGEGLIDSNPLANIKRPPVGRRDQLVSNADRVRILESASPQFRTFLVVLSELGCRPQEVRTVTAERFVPEADAWVFPPSKHKTGERTGRSRIVVLTPCMNTLTKILAAHRPSGPLFRNEDGEPWTSNAVRCAMRRLRERLDLPKGTVAYSFRHTFTTDGLSNGVSSAIMAELLGHRGTSMIDRHYGHLDQRTQQLKESLRKVKGVNHES